jgi:hypothetical protein
MKDFYGNVLAVGNDVLYGDGYSSIRQGIIEKIVPNDYVSIRETKNSHGPKTRTKYYHSVTGKWIDPYYHAEKPAGYYHKETGEQVTDEQRRQFINNTSYPYNAWDWAAKTNRITNPDYVPPELLEWRSIVYKDYVKSVELDGGAVSVLRNSKGIIKLPIES